MAAVTDDIGVLAARRIRIQIDASFVDLAAQIAPLVRRQATAVTLRIGVAVLLLLLATRILECTLIEPGRLLAGIVPVVVIVTIIAFIARLGLIVLAKTTTILGMSRRHCDNRRGGQYASDGAATDSMGNRRDTAAHIGAQYCRDTGVVDFHGVLLFRDA